MFHFEFLADTHFSEHNIGYCFRYHLPRFVSIAFNVAISIKNVRQTFKSPDDSPVGHLYRALRVA